MATRSTTTTSSARTRSSFCRTMLRIRKMRTMNSAAGRRRAAMISPLERPRPRTKRTPLSFARAIRKIKRTWSMLPMAVRFPLPPAQGWIWIDMKSHPVPASWPRSKTRTLPPRERAIASWAGSCSTRITKQTRQTLPISTTRATSRL